MKCSVSGCKSGNAVTMFCFPRPRDLCQKWVDFCRNDDVSSHFEKQQKQILTHCKICALHFSETCFTTREHKKLNRGSIPSLLHPQPSRGVDFPGNSSFPISSPPSCSTIISCLPPSKTLFPSSPSVTPSSVIQQPSSVIQQPSSVIQQPSSSHSTPLATPLCDITSPSPSSTFSESSKEKGFSLAIMNLTRRKEMTPKKMKMFLYTKSKERQIKRLQRKIQKLEVEKRLGSWNGVRNLEEMLQSSLSSSAASLLTSQLRTAGKKPKGRRWTQEEKVLSLLVYKRSPKTYRLLRCLFNLPCRSTINSMLHSIPFSPGINPQLFVSLSHSLGQMEDCGRICVLMFDEMSIMEHCDYNTSVDSVIGFEDHGHKGRSNVLAKYSLVFMVCGVLKKWKQPIAFYFSGSQTKSEVIVSLMEEVLQQCHEAGLRVIATVCDMGANNVKAIRSMGSSISNPFITYNSQTIFTIFDPPHLLKATRNLFMVHDFILPVEAGTLGVFQGTASWAHIEGAYNHAKGALLHRPLNRLTDDHVRPQGAKKMKVKLAAQIFSRSLAVYIEEGYRSGWLPSGALATSAFVGFMDDLFDSMNGKAQVNSYKPLLKGVTMESPHIQFWERAELMIQEWNMVKERRETNFKFSSMPPSQKGWLSNLKAFTMLCKELLSGPTAVAESISMGSFNQDPLENLFGCVRGNCGSNTRPTASQFISSLKTSIVNGLAFSSNASGRNCEEDDNRLLDSLRSWIDTSISRSEDDSEDDVGCSGFMVTTIDREHSDVSTAVEVSEGMLAFITNFLLRKVIQECACSGCRSALFGSAENYLSIMYYKEFCGQQNAPSRELLDLIASAMQIAERILESTPHIKGIGKHIRSTIENELTLDWFWRCCPDHTEEMTAKILHAVVKKTILWWCERRNKMSKM